MNKSILLSLVVLIISQTPTFAMFPWEVSHNGLRILRKNPQNRTIPQISKAIKEKKPVVTGYQLQVSEQNIPMDENDGLKLSQMRGSVYYGISENSSAPLIKILLDRKATQFGGDEYNINLSCASLPLHQMLALNIFGKRNFLNLDDVHISRIISDELAMRFQSLWVDGLRLAGEINNENNGVRISDPIYWARRENIESKLLAYSGDDSSTRAALEMKFDYRTHEKAVWFVKKVSDRLEFPEGLRMNLVRHFE